jgi:hypothetical protein
VRASNKLRSPQGNNVKRESTYYKQKHDQSRRVLVLEEGEVRAGEVCQVTFPFEICSILLANINPDESCTDSCDPIPNSVGPSIMSFVRPFLSLHPEEGQLSKPAQLTPIMPACRVIHDALQ